MERRRGRGVQLLAALAQLAIATFFVVRYLNEGDHLVIVIVLVGLLVGSAFLLLLGRSWSLPLSVVVNALLVGLFWLGALSRQTTGAIIGASVFSLPWALLTVHWLRERARKRREVAARERTQTALGQEPEGSSGEAEDGWTKEWAGGRINFGFMLLFGALSLVTGVGVLFDGQFANGVGLASFGVALLGAAPMFRAWSRKGKPLLQPIAERGGETGLVFPYSRSKTLGAVVGALGMGVCCGSLAFGAFTENAEPDREFVVFGVGGFLFFVGMTLIQLRRNGFGGGRIALLEGGIYATIGSAKSFVPWDAIATVDDVEMRMYMRGAAVHEPFIGLMLAHPERVEMSWIARKLMKANRWLAADLTYPVRSLDVDPQAVLRAIRYYFENPAARSELRAGRSEVVALQ